MDVQETGASVNVLFPGRGCDTVPLGPARGKAIVPRSPLGIRPLCGRQEKRKLCVREEAGYFKCQRRDGMGLFGGVALR